MELGEKLRQARMDAGLSQRQLCGEVITRNMLSLIEHGSAKPSMETLKLLAARLGKPVSYFLDEEAITSPNQSVMESASRLYDRKEYEEAALVLEGYRAPDEVYDRQKDLLSVLIYLELAEAAIRDGRYPYALELLGKHFGLFEAKGAQEDRENNLLEAILQATAQEVDTVDVSELQ